MRYLKRITYYCNRLQAQDDYRQLASIATDNGAGDLAKKYEPLPTASLKEIDMAIADLRQAYQEKIKGDA